MLKNRKVKKKTIKNAISNKIKNFKKSKRNLVQHKILGSDSNLNFFKIKI